MQIMTFHLSDGVYAVELSTVVEVVRSGGGAGETVEALEARGVPLFDLGERLGGERAATSAAPVLVLRGGGREVAMRVGRLGEVVEVPEGALRRLPRYFASPLLKAVVEFHETLLVLLDSDGLVASVREVEAEVEAGAEERR